MYGQWALATGLSSLTYCNKSPRLFCYCYDCVFICLNDCLAYLVCIVYFRDIN